MVSIPSGQFKNDNQRTPEERKLVRRLDMCFMVYACISQVIKYLDQQNISSAYVSGMKTELGLYGNELNFFTTYFNIGYLLFLIPSQAIITVVRPSIWLPSLELFWGAITGLIAACHSAKSVYACRAFLGAAEASAYPGAFVMMMAWYTPTEISKRLAFYHSMQPVGQMLASALQGAIYSSLNGHSGISGWRWLFIINCIMTIIIAVFGFIFLPDWPQSPNKKAFYLRTEGLEKAGVDRYDRYKKNGITRISWAGVKRTWMNPMPYIFLVMYVPNTLAMSATSYFNLWLNSLKNPDGTKMYTTPMVNYINIAGFATTMVAVWILGYFSDVCYKRRWLFVVIPSFVAMLPCIAMSYFTHISFAGKYVCYFIVYACMAISPLEIGWINDMIPHDSEARALLIGWGITIYYAFSAWTNPLLWPAVQAPAYSKGSLIGWKSSAFFFGVGTLGACVLRWYDLKYIQPVNEAIMNEYPVISDEESVDEKKVAQPATITPVHNLDE